LVPDSLSYKLKAYTQQRVQYAGSALRVRPQSVAWGQMSACVLPWLR
jgi:hypothetical protein